MNVKLTSSELSARRILPMIRGAALCLASGAICAALHVPLPWMIGPMLAMAAAKLGRLSVDALPLSRQAGQTIIGCTLGLYFTPPVAAVLATHGALILLGTATALVLGYACARFLSRVAHVDATTALFASMPGGAAEMSVLAERYGGRVDKVAFAQSARILSVVVIVPSALTLAGAHGSDVYQPASSVVRFAGLAFLLLSCAAGGSALAWLRVPNAWMLGPLFVTIALTVSGTDFSAMPVALSNVGQFLLGTALGARFDADFLDAAGRYVFGVAATIGLALMLFASFGVALAVFAGISVPTMILATAPGGIGEMGISAKVLRLGVPLVTAFHVTRLVLLVTTVVPCLRLARWVAAKFFLNISRR